MKWLRFLSPRYVVRLEKENAAVLGQSTRLAIAAKRLAESTNLLADKTDIRVAASTELAREAEAAITTVQGTLKTIASDMASGQIARAKQLVDALILLIEGPPHA